MYLKEEIITKVCEYIKHFQNNKKKKKSDPYIICYYKIILLK